VKDKIRDFLKEKFSSIVRKIYYSDKI